MERSMAGMQVGQQGVIAAIHIEGAIRRRLLDIGLTVGTPVECVLAGPAGDPRAFFVRGTTVALRNHDSKKIIIHYK